MKKVNQPLVQICIERILNEQFFLLEDQKRNPKEENRQKLIRNQRVLNKLHKGDLALTKEIMLSLKEEYMIKGYSSYDVKKRNFY